jgi:hypothetical protein
MEIDQLEEIKEVEAELKSLQPDEIPGYVANKISEAYESGHEDGYEAGESLYPDDEDTKAGIAFAISQVQEAIQRNLTLPELLQDLTIRSCKFM